MANKIGNGTYEFKNGAAKGKRSCVYSHFPFALILAAVVHSWTTAKCRATAAAPASNGFASPGLRFAAVWALKKPLSNSVWFDISAVAPKSAAAFAIFFEDAM